MTFGKPRDEKEFESSKGASFAVSGAGSEKVEAFLGRGSKVVGTLTFSGPAELDGQVEGEVIAQDKLTIGESAILQARVSGAEITIKGTVTGDIQASRKLALKRPAKVIGNITTASLSIEEGVVFEGKSQMSASAKTAEVKPLSPGKTMTSDKVASV